MSLTSSVTALAPFRVRSFRFQWPADLATAWAFEMEAIILGWYVLVETGSVLWLTAFGALTFLGVLLAPMFGVVGDRIGYRNLLCLMRLTYAALAGVLLTLIFTGSLTPILAFAVAILSGLVRPSDLVMRNLLVGQTMPADQLMGAMGISRTTADSARVAGSLAGAGLVAVLGMGPAYVAVVALYLGSLLLTFGVTNTAVRPTIAGTRAISPWRDMREGLSYVWNQPHLRAAMYLAFLVNLTAFPLTGTLLAYVAKNVYGIGQTGLGWLAASFAFGALVGSIALSTHGANIRPARIMLAAGGAWYALLIVFAFMTSPVAGCVLLMAAGFAQSLCMVPMAVMLLRATAPAFRGRVMGVRMLAVYGMPLGILAAGPLVARFDYAITAAIFCGVGLLFTLVIALRWRSALWNPASSANG
ncbi:MAG: MFS transporter [Alphaproteobacteria bacterium]|nr:MFS transporter [Alphaproteobacteria bacterium]